MHTHSVMSRTPLFRAVVVLCVAGLLFAPAPISRAEPVDDTTTPSPTLSPTSAPSTESVPPPMTTLTLTELGAAATLNFYGVQDSETLTVPVPRGLTPESVNAIVELPVDARPAWLTVTQDGRTISRVEVPPTDRAPIVLPLRGAKIVNNWMTVTVHGYLFSPGRYCLDPINPLRLSDATLSYTGTERSPTTVADFLPPVLRKLTIFVPREPSRAESDAAVRLAAAMAAHYRKQVPEIVAFALGAAQTSPPVPSPALERQIVISEGPDRGLSIRGAADAPWLLISGPDADLREQARLFAGELSRLAFSSNVVADLPDAAPRVVGAVTTLRDLGQPGVNAVSLAPQVAIGLDQTRFGGSVHAIRVRLRGSYSPIPDDVGGQLVAAVDGETIDHWPAAAAGTIDRWVEIPDRLLRRFTTLTVSLNVSGNTGRCGDFHTPGAGDRLLTLTIDGDSEVASRPAMPPQPGGLQSVPQVLMPRIAVGIGDDGFADTGRAVAIMVVLQRVAALPIETEVMSVREALDASGPAVLVSAAGWSDPGIVLPVAVPADGPITVTAFGPEGLPAALQLDPIAKFGSLQTVRDGDRTLFIATSNGAPAQLDGLLTWLTSDSARWATLDGVAVLAVAGRDPVTVAASSRPAAGSWVMGGRGWLWWFGGGLLAVVIVGVIALVLHRRGEPGD
ncbi:MAG: hypothetical protein K0U67_00725 [Actinomycetia bacterium]|nr:hypothetical protein [Actinomycetes bacterium]